MGCAHVWLDKFTRVQPMDYPSTS